MRHTNIEIATFAKGSSPPSVAQTIRNRIDWIEFSKQGVVMSVGDPVLNEASGRYMVIITYAMPEFDIAEEDDNGEG